MTASIFVSYASSDRNYVERLVSFLEGHRFSCWVSFRDVGVGENYQEAITRALRAAKILIVLITRNANSSGEIQKELSLASRYNVLVIPLRMEDVEPNDALAYELATRQWVDMFRDWNAGCQRLLSQLGQIVPTGAGVAPPRPAARPMTAPMIAMVAARRPPPAGSVFVPPRQLAGDLPVAVREPSPAAAVAPVPAPAVGAARPPAAPAAAVAPAVSRARVARGIPPSANRLIGALSFILFAATFGMVLSNALHREPPPYLQLLFWAILLFGCARLLRAVLRAIVRAFQQFAPSGG